MNDAIGMIVGLVVVGLIAFFVHAVTKMEDPCTEYNQQWRAQLIESHERCMVEENCIYEDWDIRKYDDRLKLQEACKLED